LKWNHELRDRTVVAAKITVYAGENEQYFSFITPEAFEAIREWMNYRRTSGEDINGESWLMRTVWDTTSPSRSPISSPKKLSTGAIKELVKRALRSVGLRTSLDRDKKVRRYEWKANHGFRKFFETNADLKMKSLYVEMLMGHNIGLAASYSKPKVDELLAEYLKAVDNLTIDKTRQKQ
jgi:integrase